MDKLLYLNESGLVLIDVAQAMLNEEATISLDWEEWEKVETLIGGLPAEQSLAVILDFVDDSHQMHWAARLFPWEKAAYEKRIEEKAHMEGAMLVRLNWFSHYRETEEGRKEQALMVSSVFGNTQLEALFSLFEEAQTSVTALYSYSFLLESYFLKKLAPSLGLSKKDLSKPMMLVFRESKFNFRQVFFNFGRLNISRHIELDNEIEGDLALNVALVHETQIAVKYLYNQKIIPFNTEVSFVYINSHGQDEQDVSAQYREKVVTSNWNQDAFFVKASELYSLTNTRHRDGSSYNTLDFLTVYLQKSRLQTFYKNQLVDRVLFFSQLKQWLLVAAVVLFFTATYFTVTFAIDDFLLSHKNSEMNRQIKSFQEEKSRLQRSVDLQYDAEDIKASVNFSESLLKLKLKGISGFDMAELSQVLSRHSHIALSELEWEKVNTFDSESVSVTLTGWVFPFHDAYEMPVKWVDELVQDFKAQPDVQDVTLLKEPLDRSLKKTLVISGASDEEMNALPFKIRLVVGDVKK